MVYTNNELSANQNFRADVNGQPNLADTHIAFDPIHPNDIQTSYKKMNAANLQLTGKHLSPMEIAITPAELRDGSLGLNDDGGKWIITGPCGSYSPEPVYQKGDENLSPREWLDTIIGRLKRNAEHEREAWGMTPEEYKQWRDARDHLLWGMGG